MADIEQQKTEKPSLEQQVVEWSAEKAEIATLIDSAKGVTVAGHVDGPKAGRDAVHNALMPIWRKGVALDKREKELLEIPKELTRRIKEVKAELAGPLAAEEARLRADRDKYDEEQEAIKKRAEEAVKARRQGRINEAVALGIVPNLEQIDGASDDEWDALTASAKAAHEAKKRAESIAATLTALGDDCAPEEAAELTDEQANHRIAVAKKAQHDTEEAARIKREEAFENERLNRVRIERVAQMVHTLASMGGAYSFADVEAMDDEAFGAAKIALQAAMDQCETERRREALGMERARMLSALGAYHAPNELAALDIVQFAAMFADAEAAKATRDQEAAKKLKDEQDRQEAARKERARAEAEATRLKTEALAPQKEVVKAWVVLMSSAIVVPEVADSGLTVRLSNAVTAIREILYDLADEMT